MPAAIDHLPALCAARGYDLSQAPPAPDGIGNIINSVCDLYYVACDHANLASELPGTEVTFRACRHSFEILMPSISKRLAPRRLFLGGHGRQDG
jgi:hypothetical protein